MRNRFYMYFYVLVSAIIGISTLMLLSLVFHWGTARGFFNVEQNLMGIAITCGSLFTLLTVCTRPRSTENAKFWPEHERLGWMLIGGGLLAWVIGSYLVGISWVTGKEQLFSWTSFLPEDFFFAAGTLLILVGLLLFPVLAIGPRRASVLVLDSLISTGSLFAIAWFVLLGALALLPGTDLTNRLLNIYVPTMEILTICVILYLLLNIFAFAESPGHRTSDTQGGTSAAYRVSLLVLSAGLILFEIANFVTNVQIQLKIYHGDPSWHDIAQAVGVMLVGLAAYLRRFLPIMIDDREEPSTGLFTLHLRLQAIQFVPYALVVFPILVLILNILSPQPVQRDIRPILTIVTLLVIVLVLIREVVTMRENEHLIQEQTVTMDQLEQASQELAQHVALRAELDVAAKIQAQLLPRQLPTVQGLDLFAHSTPMEQIGGDFYDVFAQQNTPFVFTLGDISGHGLPAALLMTMTRTVFHTATHSLALIDPQAILTRTNEDLYEDFTEVGMFVTVFVGCYDARSSRLLYANAGHSPVIYCPEGGSATLLEATAPVLGILPATSFPNEVVPFHEGDVLLVGTDGLNESFNPQGEMFGYKRLLKVVETLAHLPADEMGLELLKTIEQFTQGHRQSDDRTFMILKGINNLSMALNKCNSTRDMRTPV